MKNPQEIDARPTRNWIAWLGLIVAALWPSPLIAQVEPPDEPPDEQTEVRIEPIEPTEAAGQTKLLFRSNAAGSRIERIDPAQRGNFRHVVEYERAGTREVERLFSDGIEKRRLERQSDADGFRIEEEYREGQLSSIIRYDPERRISTEERYNSAGTLTERRNYSYVQEQRIGIEAFDGQGEPTYSETHTYTERGQLSGIERIYSDGSDALGQLQLYWRPPVRGAASRDR